MCHEYRPVSVPEERREIVTVLRDVLNYAKGNVMHARSRVGRPLDQAVVDVIPAHLSALDALAVAVKEAEKFTTISSYRDTAYVSLPQWRDLIQAITALLAGKPS